jgi:hypothetical protein
MELKQSLEKERDYYYEKHESVMNNVNGLRQEVTIAYD